MRVGIFYPNDNPEHERVLSAFRDGVEMSSGSIFSSNDLVTFGPFTGYNMNDFDVAVVFGVGKKHVPASAARGAIIDAQKMMGKPVIVLEKGFVRRDEYYSAGINGLNNRAEFKNYNCDGVRWNDLGVELQPWRKSGEHILLIAQVPWDASVQHTDHIEWLAHTIQQLHEYTEKEVIIRPHPLARDAIPSFMGARRSSQRSLAQDLMGAHAVVTFNSNTGVDALIVGIPVYAFDEGSMTWEICDRYLSNIEAPTMENREQWAYNLAYTQWNLDEMRQGLAWTHLQSVIYEELAA